MIRRGTVADISDPDNLGRIRVRLSGQSDRRHNLTPWAWPCTLFAGSGYGIFCLPRVGDEVWVDRASGGNWVWLGFSWRGEIGPPEGSGPNVRVFRTPAGHQIKFDDSGDILIAHGSGGSITLKTNGDIILGGDSGEQKLLTASFLTKFNAHTHVTLGSPPSAPVAATAPDVTEKVKAE